MNADNTSGTVGCSSANLEVPCGSGSPLLQEATRQLNKLLLDDAKSVIDDLRLQYKDHNQLLARQELLVQQLVSEMHRTISSAQHSNGAFGKSCTPRVRSPAFCGESTTTSDDYEVTPHNYAQVAQTPVLPTLPHPSSAAKTSRWLSQDVPRMSPRPSNAPPKPDSRPHLLPVGNVDAVNGAPHDDWDICDQLREPALSSLTIESGLQSSLQSKKDISGAFTTFSPEDVPTKDSTNPNAVASNIRKTRKGTRDSKVNGGQAFNFKGQMERQPLDVEEYNVEQFYKETGLAQQIARSDLFANVTLGVIITNALYIGVDAQGNDEDSVAKADLGFQICEYIFCTFFTFEWIVRFLAFERKRDCIKDMWFRFDTGLVSFMILETWLLPAMFAGSGGLPSTSWLKMLRLARLARMARLARAMPELMAMLKGLKVASRAVMCALMMLVMLVYVFSILLFTLLKAENDNEIQERFNNLGATMMTLLVDVTFIDGLGLITRALIRLKQWFCLAILMLFVLGSALTVMNMLIGVLCEVVSAVAAAEKEEVAIKIVKDKLLFLLKSMDDDGSGQISREEMQQVLENEDALFTLSNLQVEVNNLMDQLDMLYEENDGDLAVHRIMDVILTLRGDRPPTMKDMLHSQTFNRWKLKKALEAQSDHMHARLVTGRGTAQPVDPLASATNLSLELPATPTR